jgi:hypothetical protein
MRLLLDENLDWRLERDLPGHTVTSVPRMGWAGVKNGELLKRANGQFDVPLTMDQGIYHQQNLKGLSLAIVTLRAKSNRLADTRPLMSPLLALLSNVRPGEFHSISISS